MLLMSESAEGTFPVQKTTCPTAHRAFGKGPETPIHLLLIFRIAEGQERAA
jgi:hypothetical protein